MGVVQPTLLQKLSFNCQGWNKILETNDTLLKISGMTDVTLTSLLNGDILVYNLATSKFVNKPFVDFTPWSRNLATGKTHYTDAVTGAGALLVDNDLATFIRQMTYWAVDLGTSQIANKIQLAGSSAGLSQIKIDQPYLKGSNDSTNGVDGTWTNIVQLISALFRTPAGYPGWILDYKFTNTTAYRWYKVSALANSLNNYYTEWKILKKKLWEKTVDYTSSESGWAGQTFRFKIPVSKVYNSCASFKLEFARVSNDWQIGKCYIGEQATSGDEYDFKNVPTQVLFGGSAGKIFNADAILSDEVTLALDYSKNIIISLYIVTLSYIPIGGVAGIVSGYKSWYKSGDDASTQNATGYSAWSNSGKQACLNAIHIIS
jgi:hypothetical protein